MNHCNERLGRRGTEAFNVPSGIVAPGPEARPLASSEYQGNIYVHFA